MTCPAFFNFDVCDDVVGCGWTDRSPGFLVKSVEDITIEKDGGILKEIITDGSGTETPWTGDKVLELSTKFRGSPHNI